MRLIYICKSVPIFSMYTYSPHMEGKQAHKHTHTHTQIRGEGRRVDAEQHRGRLNRPGYRGQSFFHTEIRSTSEVATVAPALCHCSVTVATRNDRLQRSQSVPVVQQAPTK